MTASKKEVLASVSFALIAAFSAFTVVWVVWAFLTPGDYFANGSSLLLPSLGIGSLVGAVTGWRTRSKKLRVAIVSLGLLAIGYFTLARDGWWATPPGGHNRSSQKEAQPAVTANDWDLNVRRK